jgi:hypothetical protein
MDLWLDIAKLLVGGIVGGLLGGWLARSNERVRQLRDTIIREAAQVSEGLSASIVQLRRLQESGERVRGAPIDQDLLQRNPQNFQEIIAEAEKADLGIAPKVDAVSIFLGIPAAVKARMTRWWINQALTEARQFVVREESKSDEVLSKGVYAAYVSHAIASLDNFNRLTQDSLWSWPTPYRRRRQRRTAVKRSRKNAKVGKRTYEEGMAKILKEDMPDLEKQLDSLQKEFAIAEAETIRIEKEGKEYRRHLDEIGERIIEGLEHQPEEPPASRNRGGPQEER